MRKLARWYDVEVTFASQHVKKYHFTGRIKRQDDIASLLKLIETTANVRFTLKNRTLTVNEAE